MLCERFFSMGQPSILILAHRKELILQAEDKLKGVWPEAPVGVYAAGAGRKELRSITVASRDTFVGVLGQRPRFDVVIVDEAHNISPQEETQYRKIITALEERNPRLVVIGFTATPFRTADGVIYGDDKLFTDLVYEVKIGKLMDDGYLCPLVSKQVQEGEIDTTGLRKVAGDFSVKQQGDRANDPNVIRGALDEWHRLAYEQGRDCTVFFCIHVEHANAVSEMCWDRYGIVVPVVTGNTPQGERDAAQRLLEQGVVPAIANVGVFTEGWDCPRVNCIALLRATTSLTLYIQMVGRGLRTHPDKENTLVLDFGGNIQRFGPIDVAQPPPSRKGTGAPRCKTCPDCDSITYAGARECSECGYEFLNLRFRVCPGCGHENHSACTSCERCGHVFVNHEAEASGGDIVSAKPREQWYAVSEISAQSMRSRNGNIYLKVIYRSGFNALFYENLMIGFPGRPGARAARRWKEMTAAGTPMPEGPVAAMQYVHKGCLRKPKRIKVDMNSKWKDIMEVVYEEEESRKQGTATQRQEEEGRVQHRAVSEDDAATAPVGADD